MPPRPALALVGAISTAAIVAGCGGSKHPASLAGSLPGTRGCSVSIDSVKKVSGIDGLTRIDLAPTAALHERCATAFNSPNELVVSITEANGGAARLALVRRQHVSGPKTSVQKVAGLGDEALLIGGRFLAVRTGDLVLTLETGFTTGGKPVLTPSQLEALAKDVG